MASFEDRSLVDAIRVYRPTIKNGKAWWRYAILAERYKVRCTQRKELWQQAGMKNMDILADIRSLIQKYGLDGAKLDGGATSDKILDGINEDSANLNSENFQADTGKRLDELSSVVGDLNRENMALRKMLKTLLTPMAKESLIASELSIEDIENEISVYEEFTAKSTIHSPTPSQSDVVVNSPLRLGGSMEDDLELEDQLLASLAGSIESPSINLRSPYENLLPHIGPTVPLPHRGKGVKKSPRSKLQEKVFPSYLEQEAIRKEKAAEKKKKDIMVSAPVIFS